MSFDPSATHVAILKAINYYMRGAKGEDCYGDSVLWPFDPVNTTLIYAELFGVHDDCAQSLVDLTGRDMIEKEAAKPLDATMTIFRQDGKRVDVVIDKDEDYHDEPLWIVRIEGLGEFSHHWKGGPSGHAHEGNWGDEEGYRITPAGFSVLDNTPASQTLLPSQPIVQTVTRGKSNEQINSIGPPTELKKANLPTGEVKTPQDEGDTLEKGAHLSTANFPGLPSVSNEKDTSAEPFVPTERQEKVLNALQGKALTADAIAAETGISRRDLFKKGEKQGIVTELMQHGLVKNHPRRGYYRPDDAPPELRTNSP